MPLKHCQKNKKKGWKYGDSGTCYTTGDAREKAAKQGRAISISKARKAGHRIPNL